MTTATALLIDRCGLSIREAAQMLGVREDTVKSWRAGRNGTPPGVTAALRDLYAKIEGAAIEAIVVMATSPADSAVDLGLADDDTIAQSLGWPCVGAQAASLGLVVALSSRAVQIVPRGSTAATAKAADAHGA